MNQEFSREQTDMSRRAGILIGAANSGSGKTTFTIGLLRALRNRGLQPHPYKCGPDYIDPMFHAQAAGRESINLDPWMMSEEHIRGLLNAEFRMQNAELLPFGDENIAQPNSEFCILNSALNKSSAFNIVEGVMGLFDGYDKSCGSSAHVAQIAGLPVILIVNARSVAYSVAPIIYGFKNFCKDVNIAGVVFNMVGSERHYQYLRSACEDAGVKCLGYMQRNEALQIPSRHLGLTISAREEMERLITLAAEEIERHVDVEGILSLMNAEVKGNAECRMQNSELGCATLSSPNSNNSAFPKNSAFCILHSALKGKRIAIAKDEAFNFAYAANIAALQSLGPTKFFSPLRDKELPPCDFLYLPGGYPEFFLEQLSQNTSMRQSIKEFAERGGHIFAECGGFMYLTSDIDNVPMCDVLPLHATMNGARLHLGYRQLCIDGKILHGHEFHYSHLLPYSSLPASVTEISGQTTAAGTPVDTKLYRYKNVTAGYTHFYFAEIKSLIGGK